MHGTAPQVASVQLPSSIWNYVKKRRQSEGGLMFTWHSFVRIAGWWIFDYLIRWVTYPCLEGTLPSVKIVTFHDIQFLWSNRVSNSCILWKDVPQKKMCILSIACMIIACRVWVDIQKDAENPSIAWNCSCFQPFKDTLEHPPANFGFNLNFQIIK